VIETVLQRWASLSVRERRLTGSGGLLVVLVLLWALAYEPAATGRERLLAERATWQADLARMESLSAQVRQLGAVTSAEPQSLETLRDRLENSLDAAGFRSQIQSIRISADQIELRMKPVSAQAWLAWLDTALLETRLRVGRLSLDREGPPAAPGTVTVRMTLERPGRAG